MPVDPGTRNFIYATAFFTSLFFALGMLVMATTGATLFVAFATKAYSNTFFRIKLASIVLAGLNALYFHLTTERSITRWNDATRPPAAARFAGFASLALWTAVILAGRMMSYTMF